MMLWRESFEQYENHAPDADAFRRVHLDLLLRGRVPAGRAADANAADAFQHVQALLYATVQQQAAMLSFVDSFWMMAVLFTALVPLVFLCGSQASEWHVRRPTELALRRRSRRHNRDLAAELVGCSGLAS
jgi:hypothetical protein